MSQTTAQVSRVVEAKPKEIWRALTSPDLVRRYFFGAEVDSDFKVGSPIRFKGEFKGKTYEDKGEILAADVERRLSFSHYSPLSGEADTPANYHVVTYDLRPEGKTTRVTLTQANLQGGIKPSDIQHRADYEKNWSTVLDGLARTAVRRPFLVLI